MTTFIHCLSAWLVPDQPSSDGTPHHHRRPVLKIKTKRVLEIAREQFGCADLDGVPMEDQYLGVGAHWEARVFGPEVMSYGANSGEPYLSDITLARAAVQFVCLFVGFGAKIKPRQTTLEAWASTKRHNDVTIRWIELTGLEGKDKGCHHPLDYTHRP